MAASSAEAISSTSQSLPCFNADPLKNAPDKFGTPEVIATASTVGFWEDNLEVVVKKKITDLKQKFHSDRQLKLKELVLDVTEKEICELLSDFPVQSVQLQCGTKFSMARVVLEDPEMLDDWDNERVFLLRGKRVHVQPTPTERMLCIARLPPSFSELQLFSLVRSFGAVRKCFLMISEKSGESKGYGFVEYTTEDAGLQAKHKLDGKVIEDRILFCDWLNPSHINFESLHSKCLYIDQLPKDFRNMDEFRKVIGSVATPTYCQIAVKNGRLQDWGLIEFNSSDDAENTQVTLNGYLLHGHCIRMCYYIPGVRAINLHLKLLNYSDKIIKPDGLLPTPPAQAVIQQLQNLAKQTPAFAQSLQNIICTQNQGMLAGLYKDNEAEVSAPKPLNVRVEEGCSPFSLGEVAPGLRRYSSPEVEQGRFHPRQDASAPYWNGILGQIQGQQSVNLTQKDIKIFDKRQKTEFPPLKPVGPKTNCFPLVPPYPPPTSLPPFGGSDIAQAVLVILRAAQMQARMGNNHPYLSGYPQMADWLQNLMKLVPPPSRHNSYPLDPELFAMAHQMCPPPTTSYPYVQNCNGLSDARQLSHGANLKQQQCVKSLSNKVMLLSNTSATVSPPPGEVASRFPSPEVEEGSLHPRQDASAAYWNGILGQVQGHQSLNLTRMDIDFKHVLGGPKNPMDNTNGNHFPQAASGPGKIPHPHGKDQNNGLGIFPGNAPTNLQQIMNKELSKSQNPKASSGMLTSAIKTQRNGVPCQAVPNPSPMGFQFVPQRSPQMQGINASGENAWLADSRPQTTIAGMMTPQTPGRSIVGSPIGNGRPIFGSSLYHGVHPTLGIPEAAHKSVGVNKMKPNQFGWSPTHPLAAPAPPYGAFPGPSIEPNLWSYPGSPILASSPPSSIGTPVGQKRKYSHLLSSPEPLPEGFYVGQHLQGLGVDHADSYLKTKKN